MAKEDCKHIFKKENKEGAKHYYCEAWGQYLAGRAYNKCKECVVYKSKGILEKVLERVRGCL